MCQLPRNVNCFCLQTREQKIKDIQKDFRGHVDEKINLSQLSRAVQSDDYRKIFSVIIDSYHTTAVMKHIAEDEFMLQVIVFFDNFEGKIMMFLVTGSSYHQRFQCDEQGLQQLSHFPPHSTSSDLSSARG